MAVPSTLWTDQCLSDCLGLRCPAIPQFQFQALFSLCVVEVWAIMGYYAVILLAAIRDIDLCLYEAARIDGATAVKQFRYITLPMIQPSILL